MRQGKWYGPQFTYEDVTLQLVYPMCSIRLRSLELGLWPQIID